MDATAIHSYDFVNSKYFLSANDVVIVFSHRETKTFSRRALEIAKIHYGVITVLITGSQSLISTNTNADIRSKHVLKKTVVHSQSHLHQ